MLGQGNHKPHKNFARSFVVEP